VKDFGLLIVDKPVGPTSHQVVDIVRKGTGIRKVGHAGTLDPRASGVLVLCLGAATRLSEYLSARDKTYEAIIRFGVSTRTYDADGEVVTASGEAPSLATIRQALPAFTGVIEQAPPPFSAVKLGGRKAYELARRGETPVLAPRRVEIRRLEIAGYQPPDLSVEVECSSGTYIRTLAHDLGQVLGTGAHLLALRRTRSGSFRLADAIPITALQDALRPAPAEGNGTEPAWCRFVRPASEALPELPAVQVDSPSMDRLRNGHSLEAAQPCTGMAKALNSAGELVAILEAASDGRSWHPHKVFLT
jgi:tRNA pseudouridine55 synthase